jgi:spermidine synthase
VRETAARFDLLILDLTDPGGPSAPLYTPEFYAACAARLNPGGAMSLHIGSPFFQPARFRNAIADLKKVFACVRPYLVAVPLYGSLWGMACASETLDPKALATAEVAQRLAARGIRDLSYYNAETHGAVLALPGFVDKLTEG